MGSTLLRSPGNNILSLPTPEVFKTSRSSNRLRVCSGPTALRSRYHYANAGYPEHPGYWPACTPPVSWKISIQLKHPRKIPIPGNSSA